MSQNRDFDGKVVLLTGACGDIGQAIASAFTSRGAYLALNDLDPEEKSDALIANLSQSGRKPIFVKGDISDKKVAAMLVSTSLAEFGHIDICIGNAGIVDVAPFLEITEESWRKQLTVNLTGCFLIGQAAAKAMVQNGSAGKIIFISSWVQDVPSEGIASYCVSKSGLKLLAKCMALELGRHNITVNLIAPGFVDAGLSGRAFEADPELKEEATKKVPLGYIMSADDVAAAVLLLCSPGADYMTGSTLLVDGGNSLFLHGRPQSKKEQ